MGFEVRVSQDFAAAHKLKDYEGNCRNIHGHTWKVEVVISGDSLDQSGMLVDFRDVKHVLNTILQRFDHTLLNDVRPFDSINPTAENIARHLYDEMHREFADKLEMVRVWESANTCAAYRTEKP